MSENWLPLPIPQGRDGVTGEWAARLTRRVNALRVLFGNGFRVLSRGPDGVRVECVAVAAERAAAAPLAPWTVRHHVTEDDDDGQWEIYLPSGCMSVGAPLQNLNEAASETSGHDGDGEGVKPDPPAWRILPVDESEGSEQTRTDGDVTETYREFEVEAHAKTAARLDGVDAIDKPAKRYLWVACRKVLGPNEQQPSDEDKAKDTWGDEFSQTVARIEVGTRKKQGEEAEKYRKVTQLARAPISVAGTPPSNFDLEWTFGIDNDGSLEVKHVYCHRISTAAAGMNLTGPTFVEVTNAQESIYARIDTNAAPENVISVVLDPSNTLTGRYGFVTWLKLYDMAYNVKKADYRASSLVNVQVFR